MSKEYVISNQAVKRSYYIPLSVDEWLKAQAKLRNCSITRVLLNLVDERRQLEQLAAEAMAAPRKRAAKAKAKAPAKSAKRRAGK